VYLAASHGFGELLRTLLNFGASHSIAAKHGLYPLHAAAASRHLVCVQALIQAGASVNLTTVKCNRTPLHFAVNSSTNSTDSSFELEEYLLSQGANVNARDVRQRVPLHYSFVKIGGVKYRNVDKTDPIETVSSLCGVPGIELDVVDAFGSTPLHYAAQHGSTICSLYLLQRNAALERKDGFGNTALTIALASNHPDYAITLLQRGANVRVPVQIVTWTDKTDPVTHEVVSTSKTTEQRTFYVAISRGWQGVAYMLLDNGYEYIDAMQDAIGAGKFQLVLTLMSKTPDDATVQKLNAQKQNLYHLLCLYPSQIEGWAAAIAARLDARGVSCTLQDALGCRPIHYAAHNGHLGLLQKFLALDSKLVSSLDLNGDTPLVHAIRRTSGDNSHRNSIVAWLLQTSADPNVRFRREATDTDLLTPLCYAVATQQPFLLTMILTRPTTRIDFTDSRGRLPLVYAIQQNNETIFRAVRATLSLTHSLAMHLSNMICAVVRLVIASWQVDQYPRW